MFSRILLFLSLLGGCAIEPADVVGMSCENDGDCYFDTLVCNDGGAFPVCAYALDLDEAGCGEDGDCRSPLVCEQIATDGVCRATLGAGEGPCTDTLCDDGLTCARTLDGDVCVGELGQTCLSDTDCAAPAVCAQPNASAPTECLIPGEAGDVCGEDAACNQGLCQEETCAVPEGGACDVAEPFCAEETLCRPDEVGADRCLPPGELFDSCATDTDCVSDAACDDGQCLGDLGTACAGDDACADPWACRPNDLGTSVCSELGQPGEACDTRTDCETGECSLATATCPGSDGHTCSTEADCLDGLVCAEGFGDARSCQAPVAGCGACDSTDDCEGGAFCVAGYCEQEIEGSCDSDLCCPDGATCRSGDGYAPPACLLPSSDPGDYCDTDAACASWLTCHASECLVPEGGACEETWECAGSDSTCMLGACAERSSIGGVCVDAEGNGPYDDACAAGLLCSASLTCIAPFSVDPDGACNRDVECEAGLSCSDNLCSF